MDTDEQLIESIFSEAAEHSDPDRRCAFLDGACRGDARLRDRVEALLQANDEAGNFLQHPSTESLRISTSTSTSRQVGSPASK